MFNKTEKIFNKFQTGDVCEYFYENKCLYRFIILKKITDKNDGYLFKILEIQPKKGRIVNFFFHKFNYKNYRKVL